MFGSSRKDRRRNKREFERSRSNTAMPSGYGLMSKDSRGETFQPFEEDETFGNRTGILTADCSAGSWAGTTFIPGTGTATFYVRDLGGDPTHWIPDLAGVVVYNSLKVPITAASDFYIQFKRADGVWWVDVRDCDA